MTDAGGVLKSSFIRPLANCVCPTCQTMLVSRIMSLDGYLQPGHSDKESPLSTGDRAHQGYTKSTALPDQSPSKDRVAVAADDM